MAYGKYTIMNSGEVDVIHMFCLCICATNDGGVRVESIIKIHTINASMTCGYNDEVLFPGIYQFMTIAFKRFLIICFQTRILTDIRYDVLLSSDDTGDSVVVCRVTLLAFRGQL